MSVLGAIYLRSEDTGLQADGGLRDLRLTEDKSDARFLHRLEDNYDLDITSANVASWPATIEQNRYGSVTASAEPMIFPLRFPSRRCLFNRERHSPSFSYCPVLQRNGLNRETTRSYCIHQQVVVRVRLLCVTDRPSRHGMIEAFAGA